MSASYLEKLFGLTGQTALVIGGTGVLGGGLAAGLAQAGAHVVVAGRSRERGEMRVKAIQAVGGSAEFLPVDCSDQASLVDLREAVLASRGQLDAVVNCAGVNDATPYEEISNDDWQRVMDGNLTATHLACQVLLPTLAANENGGAVLNIGSVTAHLPLSRVYAYSASKAAVVNLTKNLAREYAGQGVRLNVLCPGFFPAEQNRDILDKARVESILSQTPLGRFGEPEELVGAALLLLSPVAGSFITGCDLYADGGFTAMRF